MGVVLELLHPQIARRSCDDCRRWIYNDGPNGNLEVMRREPGGPPEPRGVIPTPCEAGGGSSCPKGHWRNQRSLTPQNAAAYRYHEMLRAAGRPLPADPIVLRNGLLIEAAKQRVAEFRRVEMLNTIKAATLIRGVR